jgi:hypothetical protein
MALTGPLRAQIPTESCAEPLMGIDHPLIARFARTADGGMSDVSTAGRDQEPVRRAPPNSVADLDASIARAGQPALQFVTCPWAHLKEEVTHFGCLAVVTVEFITFFHDNASPIPCRAAVESQMQAARQISLRSAPCPVRALPRPRALPNVEHQDTHRRA